MHSLQLALSLGEPRSSSVFYTILSRLSMFNGHHCKGLYLTTNHDCSKVLLYLDTRHFQWMLIESCPSNIKWDLTGGSRGSKGSLVWQRLSWASIACSFISHIRPTRCHRPPSNSMLEFVCVSFHTLQLPSYSLKNLLSRDWTSKLYGSLHKPYMLHGY